RRYREALQVVYQEKLQHLSDPEQLVRSSTLEQLYPGQPLGQYIPSLSRPDLLPPVAVLRDYLHRWYVPANMALILQGPLRAETLRPLLEQTVGQWPASAPSPAVNLPPLLTPVRLQLQLPGPAEVRLAWRVPFVKARDQAAVLMLEELLVSQIGLLNFLPENSGLESASMRLLSLGPELVVVIGAQAQDGVDLGDAEKALRGRLEVAAATPMPAGRFDDVRHNLLIQLQKQLESPDERFNLAKEAMLHGQAPADWIAALYRSVQELQPQDLQRQLTGLLTQPGLTLRLEPGEAEPLAPLPELPALQSSESGQLSPFGRRLQSQAAPAQAPVALLAGRDYTRLELVPGVALYHTANPYNQLFRLEVVFGFGDRDLPGSCQMLRSLNRVGSRRQPARDFFREVYRQGGQQIDMYCGAESTLMVLEGPDQNLAALWQLAASRLEDPDLFEELLADRLAFESRKRSLRRSDPEQLHQALLEWLVYGENSSYLLDPSLQELQQLGPGDYGRFREALLKHLKRIEYSGSLRPEELRARLGQGPLLQKALSQAQPPRQEPPFRVHTPGRQRLQIHLTRVASDAAEVSLIVPGPQHRPEDEAAGLLLAEYLGGSRMSGPLMQELRENRALIYSGFVNLLSEGRRGDQDRLEINFRALSDNIVPALRAVLAQLDYPGHSTPRLAAARNYLLNGWSGFAPGFRDIPYNVWLNDYLGYTRDPGPQRWQKLQQLSDANFFAYLDQFLTRPRIVALTGEFSPQQLQQLAQLGELTEVPPERILR
ncbi:MAG TPA: insulinase family protein, partial [Candidatus Obscuribacterales bacterium]